MDDWLISIIGLLCAAGVGLLGMFLGKRSQKSMVARLHKEIIQAEVDSAHDQIQDIDDTTEMHVSQIQKRSESIEGLDGDHLADEFNGAVK